MGKITRITFSSQKKRKNSRLLFISLLDCTSEMHTGYERKTKSVAYIFGIHILIIKLFSYLCEWLQTDVTS